MLELKLPLMLSPKHKTLLPLEQLLELKLELMLLPQPEPRVKLMLMLTSKLELKLMEMVMLVLPNPFSATTNMRLLLTTHQWLLCSSSL